MAVEESALQYLPANEFTALLLRNAAVSQQFIRLLVGRKRTQQLVELAYRSLRHHVANALLRLYWLGTALIQLTPEDLTVVGTAPDSPGWAG